MTYGLAFFTALFITYFSVPSIINLAFIKKLYDEPNERKIHGRRIASLGGISIFAGFIFSFIFFSHNLYYPQLNSILAGTMILFVLGIKDDIFPLSAHKKILGQIAAVNR